MNQKFILLKSINEDAKEQKYSVTIDERYSVRREKLSFQRLKH